jgi:hypothetical protein
VLAAVAAGAGTAAPGRAALGAPTALAAAPAAIAVTAAADAALTAGCDDGVAGTTLREALCLAAGEAAAVVTVPAGTEIALTAGPLAFAPVAPATLVVTSPGTWTVTASGRRILDLDPGLVGGVDVTVAKVELHGGVPSAADAAEVGGGGAVLAGTGDPERPDALTLRDCVVTGSANAAGAGDASAPGGAVQMSGGALTIDGCTFRGNSADGAPGGAVAVLGVDPADSVVVTGSTFDGNTVTGGSGSGVLGGGALYVDGAALTVQGSTFTGNTVTSASAAAARGGAVLATGSTALAGSRVEGNAVSGSGGAADGGALWLAAGSVTSSVLVGNTDGVTGAARPASVVGPVPATASWWGCAAGAADAACGAVGVTTTAPRAALALDAAPARPATGDAVTTTARVALADGTPVPAALLRALAGRAVAWAFDPVDDAAGVQADPALAADGTAAARFTRGPGVALGVRATVDQSTAGAALEQPVPPTVSTPAGATALEGTQATFVTTVTGSPEPAVRWQRAAPGSSSWADVPGGTGAALTVDAARADDGARYRAVASNEAGTATSAPATLTVTWGPEVTEPPADAAGLPGTTARFAVAAAGSPAPAVRWQTAPSGQDVWTDVAGATGPTYDRLLGSGDAGLRVRAVLTGATGEVATAAAAITLHAAPAVTADPADQSVPEGDDATFTVAVSGTPVPTLQWQVLAPGASGWADVPGAGSPTLVVPAERAGQGARYRAVASSTAGSAVSAAATLTVLWGPEVTDPADATVVAGGVARFEVEAAGEPAPAVRWQTGDGSGWTDVPGATGPVYERTADPRDQGLLVRAVATGAAGDVPSAPATLTVHTPPTFTAQPADVTADAGGVATFTAAAAGSPTPALRWQVRAPGGAWTDVPGGASGTLTVPVTAEGDGSSYRALASNAAAADVASEVAVLRVLTPPAVGDPADVTVPDGGTARFEVTASGSPVPTVTWERSADGATWLAVPGATGPVLELPVTAADDGTLVRAVAASTLVAGPTTATSAPARVIVVTAPQVVAEPGGVGADGVLAVVAGRPVTLSWVVDADAGTATWQSSRDGGRTWGDLPDGAQVSQADVAAAPGLALRVAAAPTSGTVRHTVTYTPVAGDDGLMIRLVVANAAATVATDAVTLRVAPPEGGTTPGGTTPGGTTPGATAPGADPAGAGGAAGGGRAALGATGADAAALAAAAALLLAAGGALLLAARRRRG